MIAVVIADDDERIRADFRTILELEDDIAVLALVGDGSSAVEAAERLQADVVVMDVRMPTMNGIDATRVLRSRPAGHCRVLVVTTFDLDEYVLGAVHAGASGFLIKDQAPDNLAAAVRTVAAGDAIVAPRATARLLAELVHPTPGAAPAGHRGFLPALTARELEVVQLMAQGLSNDELASRASISLSTVKSHVSSILTKLQLASRIQVVVWAYEHDVVRTTPGARAAPDRRG